MPTLPKELADMFSRLGINRKSLLRIRFGGVVGKQALTAVGALAVLGVIAFKAGTGYLLWGCLVAVILIALATIIAIGIHGHKHPLEATLEGGEMVIMQHMRHESAAKGMEEVPTSPPVLEGIGHKALKNGKES